MFKEFNDLQKGGLSLKRMETLGLEYRLGAQLLSGAIDRKEFSVRLENEIVKYAKRQMTWFKKNKNINWIVRADAQDKALVLIERFK